LELDDYMKKAFLLSFVVPCYNAERYLQRCLDSIYRCGLEEDVYEVLCVDDCSTDGTGEILKRNEKSHNNLRVVTHEVNKGWGAPRNTGIKLVNGRYLWFVDADDVIVGQEIRMAVGKADTQSLDVLCFNYCRVDDAGKVLSRSLVFGDTDVENGYSFVKKVFGTSIVHHMGYVWRFLYRTEYLRNNKILFPEKVCWEDTVFMPKSLLDAKRVASISDVLYAYRVNVDSISSTFGRVYPAKLIYEFAFVAGGDLLRYSEEVEDDELRKAFRETAIHKYINGFPIYLFRTDGKERRRFYSLVSENKSVVDGMKRNMNSFNKLFFLPFIGRFVMECSTLAYKIKHAERQDV